MEESYSGWHNWDTWATYLWATNDSSIYNSVHVPWVRNIGKKLKSGKYDRNLMIPAVKKYWGARIIKFAKSQGDIIDAKKVDWEEITQHLEEESKEY